MRSSRLVLVLVVSAAITTAAAGAPPSVANRCGAPSLKATAIRLKASDGVALDGAVMGNGPVGVVLTHGYAGSLCDWASFAPVLVKAGYRVIMFDLRGFGNSAVVSGKRAARIDLDVRAAMAEARRRGARKVVLIGSSVGGAAVIAAAAATPVAGIVTLSSEDSATLRSSIPQFVSLDPESAIAKIRAPILLMHALSDGIVPPAASKRLLKAAGSKDKQLVTILGDAHGTDLLGDAFNGPRLQKLILQFIHDHT